MASRRAGNVSEGRATLVRRAESEAATTRHLVVNGDARDLSWIADASVHLAVTSPPYWTLKEYNKSPEQLGAVEDYEAFHDELDRVWKHVYRVLVPGGRLVCVVGDVCMSRRRNGRHVVMPLHADIVVRCRRLGFDNLSPIFWYKISNVAYEVERGGGFLGKPYEPNAIIKNDVEYILMLRKSGGYRAPTEAQRRQSRISKDEHREWFRQVWTLGGASTKEHPAPYPVELAYRLVRMFSFVGDTVLDPFLGTGSTAAACMSAGRDSIGVEIDPQYFRAAVAGLKAAADQNPLLTEIPAAEVLTATSPAAAARSARQFFG